MTNDTMFVIIKTMTDIKNHDTSPSPALVIGLRNRACATRDLAIALPLKAQDRHTACSYRAGLFAGLLSALFAPLKALSLHLKHVLLAFCSLGRRLSESFFGQDPLQREEARSRYGWTGHKSGSGFSDIARLTLDRIYFLDRF
jgi:hypothetical protein